MRSLRRKNGSNTKKLPLKAKLLIAVLLGMALYQIIGYLAIITGNFERIDTLYTYIKHTSEEIKDQLE